MSTLSVTTIKSLTASTPPVIQDSAGTQIGTFCRAWVNFNGTGTVAIRAAFNVSSITDNGVGDYTLNFATAMSDANYSAVFGGGAQAPATNAYITEQNDSVLRSTTQLRIYSQANANAVADKAVISVTIFR